VLAVDPLSAIASGALLLTVERVSLDKFLMEMEKSAIQISHIGWVTDQKGVFSEEDLHPLPRPKRDALSELFERMPPDKR
jgi:hydrogenase maturation factor